MESKTRLYKIWEKMKYRCYNKHSNSYSNYGGRGIRVPSGKTILKLLRNGPWLTVIPRLNL